MKSNLSVFGWFMLVWLSICLVVLLVQLPKESGAGLAPLIFIVLNAALILAIAIKKGFFS